MDYAGLRAAIANYLNRDDLSAEIADIFIPLAEARFNRSLIVPERELVETATASSERLALPGDFWGMRAIYADAGPKHPLAQISLAELRRTYGFGAAGPLRHYAIQGSELVFGPQPAGPVSIVMNYYGAIPALSADNASNWLLAAHPDLYLYGALAEAMAFLRDAEGLNFCEAKVAQLIEQIRKAGQRRANGGAPLAPRRIVNVRGVRA